MFVVSGADWILAAVADIDVSILLWANERIVAPPGVLRAPLLISRLGASPVFVRIFSCEFFHANRVLHPDG